MLRRGAGRVKGWQRRGSTGRGGKIGRAVPRAAALPVTPYWYSVPYHPPHPHHPPLPPPPPHHHHHPPYPHPPNPHHEKVHPHRDHLEKDYQNAKSNSNAPHDKHNHHHRKDHHDSPPTPHPSYVKRILQYIFDTIKKRPMLFTFLLTNGAFFIHRKLNPEGHQALLAEFFLSLRDWNGKRNENEKIIISKFTDSLQNYSNSFKKAVSGQSVPSAFEQMQAASFLRNLKEIEYMLSAEKKEEISRLVDSYHIENAKVSAEIGATARKLRHCQLSCILTLPNESDDGRLKENDAPNGIAAGMLFTKSLNKSQSVTTHLNKFNALTAKKFNLETQLVQLVCDLLEDNQKLELCNSLLQNNAPLSSDIFRNPVLYPEISGLSSTKRAVFVLRFNGNMSASGVATLRHEVTAVVENADKNRGDRVVVVLNSSGGAVGGYGLGASQLERIKAAGLHLTVCVDEVAASGGYLMACVADMLVSAPYATLGSIGVMTMVPNFHERLKREGVSVDTVTAGDFKTTLTPTSKPSKEKRQKLQEDLNSVHETFKGHILKYRPEVNIDKVSTGESWLASDALNLGLCDSIATSDDFLLKLSKMEGTEVYHVKYNPSRRKSLVRNLLQDEDNDEDASEYGIDDNSSNYIANFLALIISKTLGYATLPQSACHPPDKRL